jgi:glucose uptake protein GlcU
MLIVEKDPVLGFQAALLAVLFFGSNYVPAKHVKVGDGVFFQFIMCVSIWVTSLPVLFYMVEAFPATSTEFAIAMGGGFLWCTGNMLCAFIIQLIGIGLGLLVWGSFNMLMGWASGCFGLFGLRAEPIAIPSWNYAGVALALVGLALFLQVKPTTTEDSDDNDNDSGAPRGYASISGADVPGGEQQQQSGYVSVLRSTSSGFLPNLLVVDGGSDSHHLAGGPEADDVEMVLPGESLESPPIKAEERDSVNMMMMTTRHRIRSQSHSTAAAAGAGAGAGTGASAGGAGSDDSRGSNPYGNSDSDDHCHDDAFRTWTSGKKRVVGCLCSVVAGGLFGCSFNPAQWIIDNHPNTYSPETLLAFVFPHYCGIALCSFLYFIVYCAVMRYHLKRRPFVTPEVVLPAVLSGALWGVAEICWFIANQHLGFAISFPLITSGPGFVGALWGIFMFNEIKGRRNLAILGVAGVVTVGALVLVGLSH